jgi:hypothetical protein
MWLDNTAATNFAADGVGHAKPDGDRISFISRTRTGAEFTPPFVRSRDRYVVMDDRQRA